jgi:transcriptional regulator with XRE-family HTH domain
MQIAARIRQVRLEHSLTLEELAEEAGLSPSFLGRVEDGNAVPSLEMIDRLAEAVGVPIRSLFYDDRDAAAPASAASPILQRLIGKIRLSARATAVPLLTLRGGLATAKMLLSLITRGGRWR